jgi:hypothetical protein
MTDLMACYGRLETSNCNPRKNGKPIWMIRRSKDRGASMPLLTRFSAWRAELLDIKGVVMVGDGSRSGIVVVLMMALRSVRSPAWFP